MTVSKELSTSERRLTVVGVGVPIVFVIEITAVVALWVLEFLCHLEQMEVLGVGAQEIRQTISER
jgi:hypothetical protein